MDLSIIRAVYKCVGTEKTDNRGRTLTLNGSMMLRQLSVAALGKSSSTSPSRSGQRSALGPRLGFHFFMSPCRNENIKVKFICPRRIQILWLHPFLILPVCFQATRHLWNTISQWNNLLSVIKAPNTICGGKKKQLKRLLMSHMITTWWTLRAAAISVILSHGAEGNVIGRGGVLIEPNAVDCVVYVYMSI